ncbi:hypothetical protein BY996DRAFT_6538945 [Phakopsora pachyrhizi]|nr:hypothetical protein BY996DRAFT_6538945 [Phakopsora pachyrhizi]
MDREIDEIDLPQNSDCSKLGDQNNKMNEEEESEVLMKDFNPLERQALLIIILTTPIGNLVAKIIAISTLFIAVFIILPTSYEPFLMLLPLDL